MTICLVDGGGGAQERLHRRLVTIQPCPKQRGVMRVDGICPVDAARLGRQMHPKQRQLPWRAARRRASGPAGCARQTRPRSSREQHASRARSSFSAAA
jgi:hypothetical protein